LTNTPWGYIIVLRIKQTIGKEAKQMENCCERTKMRNEDEKKALINRLNRIEGQVRGVRAMVERDAYCADILMQVSAISAALSSFNKELLSEHIRTCVANDIKEGNDEKTDELLSILGKLLK
jgi:DNA-binding FrmR family transcriptional regulator